MYRWNASDYAAYSTAQQQWAEELIAKVGLRGEERVLDIGCGDGKVTVKIAAATPRGSVLGVDSSEEMIRFARNTFLPEKHPNLSFDVADARHLHFASEFDIVFSNACLHWVTNHRSVLKGIRRSLKPRGRIFLQMGGRGNAAPILAVLEEMMREPEWAGYFKEFAFPYGFYGPEEYTRWLEEAGLKPVRVELIPKDMISPGKDGLAGWIRTTWLPYTARVPEEKREAFIREIVCRYTDRRPLDAEGRTHIPMIRLEVEAERNFGE